MKTNNNIPAYRFQGYTDAWELRKLGEISTHRGGTAIENHFSEDGKYKVISIGSYGLDNKYIDQKIRAVENEVTRSKVVNKNELTMVLNDKTANGNIIGRCLLIEADDEFVINQRTEIISFNSVIYPKFAYVVLNGVFREQVKKIVQGGTQIYVNYSSVEQLYLSLPSLPEQEAIGTFFSTLDRHITLHQRKFDTLKEQKKTYLKLLIPAKGQTKPALRFQGFEDDWEEVKVADIFQVTRGQVLSTNLVSDTKSDEYPYPVYSSQTKNNGLMGFYKDYLFDTAITWTTDGANAGTVRFREGKFYSTNVNGVLLSAEGYNNLAISEILNTVAWKYVSKVGNPKLMNNIMSEIILLIPGGFAEQEVIGTFFSTLDQKIAQVEDKLASLKEMKKTLLRKLFV
ncbi:TPA: restriction endonuclease subunit S [Streptococcus suis]|nr:restriction endonuclease subunit S [Streptococcus suis]HEM6032557.1 restriction endonuclease subunit S [Streptococcus suis]